MKKTLIAVAAAAALTTSAFAEITFGAWLRVLPTVGSNGDETVAGMSNSWGWGARVARIGVDGKAEDGNAGFHMGVFEDAEGGISKDDGTYMWVKPIEQVKLTVGQLDNNTGLRGDFCYGSWNWVRPVNWLYDGEGLTFSKVDQCGALVEVTPVEGLKVYAAVPLAENYTTKAEDQFKNVQAGFGYTIDGVGNLKAQYIGGADKDDPATADKDESKKTIEAAFDLTSVENLYATVGFAYYQYDDVQPFEQTIKLAVGVSYQINDAAKISADFEYAGYDDADADMAFGVGLDYALENGIGLSADVRALMASKDTTGADAETYMSFLIGASKGISSNASLGVAFQGSTNGYGFLSSWNDGTTASGMVPAKADSFCWAIPVRVEMWF